MKLDEFLQNALYLSLYDRNFQKIPEYKLNSYADFPDPSLCKTTYKPKYTEVFDLLKALQDFGEKEFDKYPIPEDWPTTGGSSPFSVFKTNAPDVQYQKASELYAERYFSWSDLLVYVPLAKRILASISNKNGGFTSHSYPIALVQEDKENGLPFIEPSGGSFYDICSVEYKYGVTSYSLYLLPLNEFLSNSSPRVSSGLPYVYNYNVQSNKLYLFPKPGVSGDIVVFGKKNLGTFSNLEDEISEEASDSFLQYATYLFAKELCAQHNIPWQAQKESALLDHKKNVQFQGGLNFSDRANPKFAEETYGPYYRGRL